MLSPKDLLLSLYKNSFSLHLDKKIFLFYILPVIFAHQLPKCFSLQDYNLPCELISYVYTFLLFQCLSLKWWITPMMKILKSSARCVEIKCLDTIMGSSPVKAARFAYTLLPDKYKVQNQNKPLDCFLKLYLGCLFWTQLKMRERVLGRWFFEICV